MLLLLVCRLLLSSTQNSPRGRYFAGDFDGQRFIIILRTILKRAHFNDYVFIESTITQQIEDTNIVVRQESSYFFITYADAIHPKK